MARKYNCRCGQSHIVGEECPNRYKYKRQNASEINKKVNQFYTSKDWTIKKEQIKTRDKGMCQRCLIKFERITITDLEIHHIEKLMVRWEKRLQDDNLVCLCKRCHRYIDMMNNGELDFEFNSSNEETEKREFVFF